MKRTIKKSTISIILMVMCSFTLSSCLKTETGPQGPQGAQGPQGNEGPQGQQGNANVLTSNYRIVNWNQTSNFYYYIDLNVPNLTSSVLASGAVLVYFSMSPENWNAIPLITIGSQYTLQYEMFLNTIRVSWIYNSASGTSINPFYFYGGAMNIKVVIIPSGLKSPNIDYSKF